MSNPGKTVGHGTAEDNVSKEAVGICLEKYVETSKLPLRTATTLCINFNRILLFPGV